MTVTSAHCRFLDRAFIAMLCCIASPVFADTRLARPATPTVVSRAEVLSSNAEHLQRVGRHIIVGFQDFDGVKRLVEHGAIAGIFITGRNVRGRSLDKVRADIDTLQAIRTMRGDPPLIVAADQEGGQVSRLSPPLARYPTLGRIMAIAKTRQQGRSEIIATARAQADALKRIGVSLNFAPVVDLNLPGRGNDGETLLATRAVASDPTLVAQVADWYCGALAESDIFCSLKHFPGLGRVSRDTHVTSGQIDASVARLALTDWLPFRRVMSRSNAVVMLGHVRINAIDAERSASHSSKVINTLLRQTWRYDGVLVTDDFSMGAITRLKGGAGQAAVEALNAGADLVLLSFNEKHLDGVLSALIDADINGSLDQKQLAESARRLARTFAPRGMRAAER